MRTEVLAGVAAAIVILAAVACDGELRGDVSPSPDGGTYLVVAESNGCETITIDGESWPFEIGEPGPIEPGVHVIDCNGEIAFEVEPGTTFSFDYWGP